MGWDAGDELSRSRPAGTGTASTEAFTKLKTDNARLGREKRDLVHQLARAIAAIQRLSADNDHLRTALRDARSVIAIPPAPR
ncbi:hypothetical protein [Streptomyces sp. MMG1121]|uniref:hypothetical protein n=1 Tax=Streptomyces sp. MMG1121 TaxID=1415544 RepID=UPI0006AE994A|nr:hypothetical protein [Streptomyces sp. MMG1121]KOV60213.1 hypothetical protein ADK64_31690 [Streptomyces sp. MMG1121]